LSQDFFSLMAQLYSTPTSTSGLVALCESHSAPGFATSAGPFGPSKAMPTERPSPKAFNKCLTSLCPLLPDPLKTSYPRLLQSFANLVPSSLLLIKTAIFLRLKAARQAGKSWCHKPITTEPFGKGPLNFTRQERTRIFRIKFSILHNLLYLTAKGSVLLYRR